MTASDQVKKPETILNRGFLPEMLLLLFLCLYGYLAMRYKPFTTFGIVLSIFALLGIGALLYTLHINNKILSSDAHFVLVLTCLLSIGFALFENTSIKEPLLLVLLFCVSLIGDSDLSPQGAKNAVLLWIIKPFANLKANLTVPIQIKKDRGNIAPVIIGAVLALLLMFILTVLLSSADVLFSNAINVITSYLSESLIEELFYIFSGVIAGCYLFSFVLSAANQTKEDMPAVSRTLLPTVTLKILLYAADAVYILFLLIQFTALTMDGKSAYLASLTAREGFFSMCVILLINLALLAAASSHPKEKTRFASVLLCLLAEIMIILTVVKMALYIFYWGLTLLRFETTWFMVSLALAFLLILIGQFKRLKLFRMTAVLCLISIIAVSFVNVGGIVCNSNANRYLSGSLQSFDMAQYSAFTYEAAPSLISLYTKTEDPILREGIIVLLKQTQNDDEVSFMFKSIQRIRAENAIASFLKSTEMLK